MTTINVAASAPVSAPVAGDNGRDKLFNQFIKEVRKFGALEGKGADALIDMARAAVEMADAGVIDTEKGSRSANKDDATVIYEEYISSASKVQQHTKGSVTAHTSELRQLIAMGNMTTIGDAVTYFDHILTVRAKVAASGDKVKVRKVWECLVTSARKTIAAKKRLTDAELSELCLKPEPNKDEMEKLGDLLSSCRKRHEAQTGNADAQIALEAAIENVRGAITAAGGDPNEYDREAKKAAEKMVKAQAQAAQKIAALGLSRDQLAALLGVAA
jgi:hypothetical protein